MTDNTTAPRSALLSGIVPRTLTPAAVAGIYLVAAVVSLYVSDVLLPAVVTDQPLLERLQLAKGVLEIAATVVLIYALTARSWGSLRETSEHLAAARRELNVLHRIFRHNLRNDITVVAGYAETLEDEVDRPRLEDHCDAIRSSCRDLITYTEKAKLVADLNRSGVETTEVDIGTTMERVVERAEPLPPNVEFDVSIDGGGVVDAHEYLEFAIVELVENALVHNDAASPSVSVSVRDAPECASWKQVTVVDNGPGIPEEELDALDTEEQPLHHGSGVGLWVASWIVLQSGGDFDVENTATGTRVTVRLPTPETAPVHRAEAALRRFLE